MVSAVILAAGASARMGMPKALLKIGQKTFVEHIVEVLASACILDIVVVVGPEAGEIKRSLEWFKGKIVVNDEWHKGQITSIIAGINALVPDDLHGALICPVDHPLISQSLIVDMLQAFWKSKKRIILPVHEGRRGHPVIFAASLFDELRSAPPDIGARAVVHKYPDDVVEVLTKESGVIVNIDTLEDYEHNILKRSS